MPTYKNNSRTNHYNIRERSGNLRAVKPNEIIESFEIIDLPSPDYPDLVLISAEPYFNPTLQIEQIYFLDTTPIEVVLDDFKNVSRIDISDVSDCSIEVYLNDVAAEMTELLSVGGSFKISVFGKVKKVILISSGVGSCVLRTRKIIDGPSS